MDVEPRNRLFWSRRKRVRRGIHHSTIDLERTITGYIETVNEDPRPFRWHTSADDMLAVITCCCCRTPETTAATAS